MRYDYSVIKIRISANALIHQLILFILIIISALPIKRNVYQHVYFKIYRERLYKYTCICQPLRKGINFLNFLVNHLLYINQVYSYINVFQNTFLDSVHLRYFSNCRYGVFLMKIISSSFLLNLFQFNMN